MVNKIIAFEQGELNNKETLELFSELVATGLVWRLQGSYGRTANYLIKSRLLDTEGTINWEEFNSLKEYYDH